MSEPQKKLMGVSVRKVAETIETKVELSPDTIARVIRTLSTPEMRGVDLDEFLNRACETVETEIAVSKRQARERRRVEVENRRHLTQRGIVS